MRLVSKRRKIKTFKGRTKARKSRQMKCGSGDDIDTVRERRERDRAEKVLLHGLRNERLTRGQMLWYLIEMRKGD